MKKRIIVSILCTLSILFIISISILFGIKPNIKLNGKEKIVINLEDKYNEKGAKAYNLFGDIKEKIKIDGTVNNKKVGIYNIKYSIKKGIFYIKSERKVEVKDNVSPEISLEGSQEVIVCPNHEYTELGYKATDNYDGDITDKLSIINDKNVIKYKVSDSSNNTTTIERNIKYEDTDKPTITLKGKSNIYLKVGNKYTEPGYTATDNCDGEITNKVTVSGSVNTNSTGSYTLTYSVKDSSSNEISVNRVVTVYLPVTQTQSANGNGVIYLTFDDGPSNTITPKVLDILKEENVKATFFVINKSNNLNYLIKRAYDEGHTIALHSATHNYSTVYSSVNAYFNDLTSIQNKVKGIIGTDSKIIRFPGGSSNTVSRNYSSGIMSILVNEVTSRGYKYFDWNIGSGDAGGAKNSSDVYNNVISGLSHSKTNVVLMHDFENNYKTLNALRDIIVYGKAHGYSFSNITNETPQVKHSVNN